MELRVDIVHPDQVRATPRRRTTILRHHGLAELEAEVKASVKEAHGRPTGWSDDVITNYERASTKRIKEKNPNVPRLKRAPGRKAKGQQRVIEHVRKTHPAAFVSLDLALDPRGLPPHISHQDIALACGVDNRTVRRAFGLK
jgi:hypothetical protein